jgi:hypothetical protein
MSWDKPKAIKFLQDHAEPPYGVGKCAAYVINAIEAGGLTIARTATGSAKTLGPILTAAGFKAQAGVPVPYQSGDVAVIDGFSKTAADGIKRDHPHGQMDMFDGTQWISDLKQTGVSPYLGIDYEKAKSSFLIYRLQE